MAYLRNLRIQYCNELLGPCGNLWSLVPFAVCLWGGDIFTVTGHWFCYVGVLFGILLKLCLAFFLPHLTFYLTDISPSLWHAIWHSLWHYIWHITWHVFWHLCGVLSGILSDAAFIWHSILHPFWHFIWHSIWHSSGIWPGVLHTFWHWISHSICIRYYIWHGTSHFIRQCWDFGIFAVSGSHASELASGCPQSVERGKAEQEDDWTTDMKSRDLMRPSPGREKGNAFFLMIGWFIKLMINQQRNHIGWFILCFNDSQWFLIGWTNQCLSILKLQSEKTDGFH